MGVTVDRHAREDLGLTPTDGDPSLYKVTKEDNPDKKESDAPVGCMGSYGDDGILTGNMASEEVTMETLRNLSQRTDYSMTSTFRMLHKL